MNFYNKLQRNPLLNINFQDNDGISLRNIPNRTEIYSKKEAHFFVVVAVFIEHSYQYIM